MLQLYTKLKIISPPFFILFILLSGCIQNSSYSIDIEIPVTSIVESPVQVRLGETAKIEWNVAANLLLSHYRSGIHFTLTNETSNSIVKIEDFQGHTEHRMGYGGGNFFVKITPYESKIIYYRLHVEYQYHSIWSDEYTLEVLPPNRPVALIDPDSLPETFRMGQENEVRWRFDTPTDERVASVEAVALQPDGTEVQVGWNGTPVGPGSHSVPVRFPAPGLSVQLRLRATLEDGQVIESRSHPVQVVHPQGALGRMVGGEASAPAGNVFLLAWQLEGNQGPDHHDLHLGMHGYGAELDDPASLYEQAVPRWDDDQGVYWTMLDVSQPGFLIARIHTVVDGIETWSRSYTVEVYPAEPG